MHRSGLWALSGLEEAKEPLPKWAVEVLRAYVLDNEVHRLIDYRRELGELSRNPEFAWAMSPSGYERAYRFVDVLNVAHLAEVLGFKASKVEKTLEGGGYGRRKNGELRSPDSTVSSWTVHPRSLVFSGYLSVVQRQKAKGLALFAAPIEGNEFVGNPDGIVLAAELPSDREVGYAFEREVLGFGPVKYGQCVYGMLRSGQSMEGLAADLIDLVSPLKKVKDSDWTTRYYVGDLLDDEE